MKDAFATLLQGSKSAAGSSQKPASQKQPGSGAKRPRGASQGSQEPGGKYTACPVCATSVPKSFLQLHVATCLEKANQQAYKAAGNAPQQQDQQQHQQEQRPLPLTPRTPAVAAAADPEGEAPCSTGEQHHRAPSTQQPVQHILDEQQQLLQLQPEAGPSSSRHAPAQHRQQHGQPAAAAAQRASESPTASTPLLPPLAAPHSGAQPQQPSLPSQTQPAAAAAATAAAAEAYGPDSMEEGPEMDSYENDAQERLQTGSTAGPSSMPPPAPSASQAPSKGPGTGAPSAFDVLRQGQRLQQQVHIFFLERSPTGAWKWHWWQKGVQRVAPTDATAAWSCSTTLTLPKSSTSSASTSSAGPVKVKATLQLLTNVPSGDGAAVNWDNATLSSNSSGGSGRWRGGASVLKSALQKNVRLCRADSAVRVALALLKEDPAEFLRRISIICLEDALLHPALPLLMWLTAAQAKGYVLGGTMCNACLRIAYQLAAVDVRDMAPVASANARTRTYAEVDEQLPHAEAALVKAMMMRAAYGGMPGDVHMLKGYAALWAARFAGEAGQPPLAGAEEPGDADAAGVPMQQQDAEGAGTSSADTRAGALASHAASAEAAVGGASGSCRAADGAVAEPVAGAVAGRSKGPMPMEAGDVAEQGLQLMASGMTPWLEYMRGVYMALPMGAAATQVTIVGAMQRDDIPLSAIDFHVSEVVPHLLQDAAVQAALQQLSISKLGFREASPEGLVQNAMWVFSSSTSNKAWVLQRPHSKRRRQASQQSPGPGTSLERHALAEQLDKDSAMRERLQPLWAAAAPVAERYAQAYIKQRLR